MVKPDLQRRLVQLAREFAVAAAKREVCLYGEVVVASLGPSQRKKDKATRTTRANLILYNPDPTHEVAPPPPPFRLLEEKLAYMPGAASVMTEATKAYLDERAKYESAQVAAFSLLEGREGPVTDSTMAAIEQALGPWFDKVNVQSFEVHDRKCEEIAGEVSLIVVELTQLQFAPRQATLER